MNQSYGFFRRRNWSDKQFEFRQSYASLLFFKLQDAFPFVIYEEHAMWPRVWKLIGGEVSWAKMLRSNSNHAAQYNRGVAQSG